MRISWTLTAVAQLTEIQRECVRVRLMPPESDSAQVLVDNVTRRIWDGSRPNRINFVEKGDEVRILFGEERIPFRWFGPLKVVYRERNDVVEVLAVINGHQMHPPNRHDWNYLKINPWTGEKLP